MKNFSHSIEDFSVVLAEIMDSQCIEIERKAITESIKVFNKLVSNLEVDLDGDEQEEDVNRLSKLEQMRREF